jgi:hypothetical protein
MPVILFLFLGLAFIISTEPAARAADASPLYVDQGPDWTPAARADFYGRDQGSRLIPLAWLQALQQPNGQSFLADGLARYGYLPNPASSNGLPVGFTASGPAGSQAAGMTCAACHTRQITAEGKTYRIDGGPAIVDFQSFLADLDVAVGRVLAGDSAFQPFAAAVLGSPAATSDDIAALHQEVDAWYLRYHTIMSRALPTQPWGPARLDAVGMIFNRVTGLDLGPPPSFLIPDNIRKADAPVRYPFIWNAPLQDKTQWPGFAANGNDTLALGRNLGEVFGVFGLFEPKQEIFFVNFLNNNSANFDGLAKLEDLVRQIGSPRWPWLIDTNLAAQGKAIFARSIDEGGCAACHGIAPGTVRLLNVKTWATPLRDVGTDTREWDIMGWTAKTGLLQGVFIPLATDPLKETDLSFNVLATSVLGSIAEHVLSGGGGVLASAPNTQPQTAPPAPGTVRPGIPMRLPPALRELPSVFPLPPTQSLTPQGLPPSGGPAPAAAPPTPRGSYEARVLLGIWAAAPYLHNGSVRSLTELLKPASERAKSFQIGPAYDTVEVGLAPQQTEFSYTLETTDCADRNSGNSRCGHEYGTQLKPEEKKALIEYLKTL